MDIALKEKELFNEYVQTICKKYWRGDSSEKTFRTAFENLIENINELFSLSQETKKDKFKDEYFGLPDFRAFIKPGDRKVGYIETKDLDINLDKIKESKQIKKYLSSERNLLVTNYIGIKYFRDGKEISEASLFNLSSLKKREIPPIEDRDILNFENIIKEFFSYKTKEIKTEEELAIELSKKAKILSDFAEQQLELEKHTGKKGSVSEFYDGFKEMIGEDTRDILCIEAYAETITYGFFLAKLETKKEGELTRINAHHFIPSQIPIIKTIFMHIMEGNISESMSWVIDDIIDILNSTHFEKFLEDFHLEGKTYRDPFIHFYEPFLEKFNPKRRKEMGVFYTPLPIVSFITRSVNEILKKEFNLKLGYIDKSVTILDPCIGTGTFIASAILDGFRELKKSGRQAIKNEVIKNHFLKRFFGFEILISPYIVAHLKIALLLKQEGYELDKDERIPVYLTNTLNPDQKIRSIPGFLSALHEEVTMADKIKTKMPILVVMGNPPYSKSSFNKSPWILKKLEDYKRELNEKNKQPLDDDYIKFIRFAHYKIKEYNYGIIGFITNNSYLNGLIHRVMRNELLKEFDNIYILNLHGNSRVNEGKEDKNVFPIRPGVAIILLVKKEGLPKKVDYFEIRGSKEDKFDYLLSKKHVYNIKWKTLKPDEKWHFFIPFKLNKQLEENSFHIKNIFKKCCIGTKTSHDDLVIGFDKKELIMRFNDLFNQDITTVHLKNKFNLRGNLRWLETKRNTCKKNMDSIKEYYYRPFDIREIYYDDNFIDRSRRGFMEEIDLKENLFLNVGRAGQNVKSEIWDLVSITSGLTDLNLFYRGGSTLFPLYYKKAIKDKLSKQIVEEKKEVNFTEKFKEFLIKKYPYYKPEDIFYYVYGMLHSNKYREIFRAYLKIDFPLIHFPNQYSNLKRIANLGKKLIDLHLLKFKFAKDISNFNEKGDDMIEHVKFEDKKIFINEKQYFGNIKEEYWDFFVGGYRVLEKWLKDRKGRILSRDEIEVYLNIINSIDETIKIQSKLDRLIKL